MAIQSPYSFLRENLHIEIYGFCFRFVLKSSGGLFAGENPEHEE